MHGLNIDKQQYSPEPHKRHDTSDVDVDFINTHDNYVNREGTKEDPLNTQVGNYEHRDWRHNVGLIGSTPNGDLRHHRRNRLPAYYKPYREHHDYKTIYIPVVHVGRHGTPEVMAGLTLNASIATKVFCFSRLLKCLRSLYGKQCGPRSDCSYGSSLFWASAVCIYT